MAVTLMEMLPPSGWGDVATRQQLDALESRIDAKLEALELRMDTRFAALEGRSDGRFDAIDLRFDAIDLRFETIDLRFAAMERRFDAVDERMDLKLATLESRIETRIAIGHRQLMQWTVGTMIAMTGVFAALVSIIK